MSARALGVACVLAGAGAAIAQGSETQVVSPNSRATTEGNDANFFPFANPDLTRYQQVFGSGSLAAIGGRQITRIAFRLDASHTQAYAGGFHYPQLTIKLSITPRAVADLSTNMDSNVGPGPVTVYNGAYTLPTLSATGAPHPFDMVINLQTPFQYAGGNLLMDINGGLGPPLASGLTFYLDCESTLGDSVARVYGTSISTFADTRGLVTQFTVAPLGCYANCDASTTPPILNALDFTCFLNRFAAGDTYANCDASTSPPVLNALDFNCFLNRFTAGCS